MRPGVRSPSAMRRDRPSLQFFQRAVHNALNRRLLRLRLPAEIIRAVVCDCDPIFHTNFTRNATLLMMVASSTLHCKGGFTAFIRFEWRMEDPVSHSNLAYPVQGIR